MNRAWQAWTVVSLASSLVSLPLQATAADPGDVRSRAEQSFEQLKEQTGRTGVTPSKAETRYNTTDRSSYSSDQYLIGKGQGDLAKGPIICQRVSELSARADLAKQIRILVKEHMVDRLRERTGGDAEQDIEVTREEIVQEYLQGVKIVDRQLDETNKTCSATAVMPKSQVQSKPAHDHPESTPTVTH
ncbi:MAG TPA: hypothetical protein VKP13_19095 [Nitrospira sp.]|nr:hypothetical protein [Nitrospira sp.]